MRKSMQVLDFDSDSGTSVIHVENEKLPNSKIEKIKTRTRKKIKTNEIYINFFTDCYKYSNEKDEEIYNSGFYIIEFNLKNLKDIRMGFLKFITRVAAIHLIIGERTFPFRAVGITKEWSVTKPIHDPNERFLHPNEMKRIFEYFKNDFDIINEKIKSNSVLEKSIIWYYYALISQSPLDMFLNLFRSLEVLIEQEFKNSQQNLNIYLKKVLSRSVYNKNKNMLRLNKESKFMDYMNRYDADETLSKRTWDYRNDIVHGVVYHYQFDSDFIEITSKLKEFVEEQIYNKIRQKNLRDFKNPIFEKDYTLGINSDTKKWVLFDLKSTSYKKIDKELGEGFHDYKGFGTLSQDEINMIINSEDLSDEIKNDYKYHMDRHKIKYVITK